MQISAETRKIIFSEEEQAEIGLGKREYLISGAGVLATLHLPRKMEGLAHSIMNQTTPAIFNVEAENLDLIDRPTLEDEAQLLKLWDVCDALNELHQIYIDGNGGIDI